LGKGNTLLLFEISLKKLVKWKFTVLWLKHLSSHVSVCVCLCVCVCVCARAHVCMYICSPRIESLQEQDISVFFKTSILALEPTQWGFFHPRYRGWSVKLTSHFHLVSRLRISEAMPLRSLYNFKMWTGTT
jgi:hypothetical protein